MAMVTIIMVIMCGDIGDNDNNGFGSENINCNHKNNGGCVVRL